MASFVRGLLIFTIFMIYSEHCICKPAGVSEAKGALHFVEKVCGTNTTSPLRSRILLCFICKGLDPSCISSTTTTTTTSSTTTTTARPSSSSSRTSTTNVASIAPTTTEE